MTIAVGLVGFGVSGRWLHAPLLQAAGLQLAGVVTRQAEAVHAAVSHAQVADSLEALLALQPLDLIVLATPNHLHRSQALAALRAGKHVVVDKPFALTVREADEIIEAATIANRQLTVFHNRRWDADFLTLGRLTRDGALGEVSYYEARWDRFRPQVPERWRERSEAGGGVLYDLGAHLIDQALQLFGMPQWLQADLFAQRPGATVEDGFEIRMARDRLRIVLAVSSVAADHGLRYRVHGSAGSFRKSGLDVQEQQLRAGGSPLDPGFGIEPEGQWGRVTAADSLAEHSVVSEHGDWLAFYRQVRLSIEGQAPVPVTAASARAVLQIIEAARASDEQGRRIELSG